MMKSAKALDLEPVERLEEKVKLLVGAIDRLRGERLKMHDENAQLRTQMEALRTRVADMEGAADEVSALREERDEVRARVADILEQLEGIDI